MPRFQHHSLSFLALVFSFFTILHVQILSKQFSNIANPARTHWFKSLSTLHFHVKVMTNCSPPSDRLRRNYLTLFSQRAVLAHLYTSRSSSLWKSTVPALSDCPKLEPFHLTFVTHSLSSYECKMLLCEHLSVIKFTCFSTTPDPLFFSSYIKQSNTC